MESQINGSLDVPEDLLLDILSRLPVKSLSRFKCVSKEWYGLIESPSFVKQHFNHKSNRQRLLIRLPKQDQEVNEEEEETFVGQHMLSSGEHIDVDYANFLMQMIGNEDQRDRFLQPEEMLRDEGYKYILYVDETFSEYEVPAHLQFPHDEATDVLGPLNGVVCVAVEHDWGSKIALLNPALRQFKPLPPIAKPTTPLYNHKLGLGLDPLTGDYKLVSLLYLIDTNRDDLFSQCVVSVCTSDSDSWRVLDDVDNIPLSRFANRSLCNTYLNGAYYWLLDYYHTTDVPILAFDMGTDKFRQMQVPGCGAPSKHCYLALCGDSLALLMYDKLEHAGRFIDVWIMKNEGSWFKSSRVDPLEGIKRPLCFWKNNELLLETNTMLLALCNVSTQELKIAKRKFLGHFSHWVLAYKESLVSIKGESSKCILWDTSSDLVKDFFKVSSSSQEGYI